MPALAIMDGDRRDAIVRMALDEAEEGSQQPDLVLGPTRADLRGDGLVGIARKLDRAAVFLVLPARRGIRLAAHPHIGAAAFPLDGVLLVNKRAEQPRARARNDLEDFH